MYLCTRDAEFVTIKIYCNENNIKVSAVVPFASGQHCALGTGVWRNKGDNEKMPGENE